MGGITLTSECTITQQTSASYIQAIVFSAGQNTFQVDQVTKEIDNQTSTYTQLVPSKHVAACNTRVQ